MPWITCMGLRFWRIHLEYVQHAHEMQGRRSASSPEGTVCLGMAQAEWKYCEATLVLNCEELASRSDDEVEHVIVHELCHVLVNEMREWAGSHMPDDEWAAYMKHEERVVTQLEKAFMWTRSEWERKKKSTDAHRSR